MGKYHSEMSKAVDKKKPRRALRAPPGMRCAR